MQTDRPLPVPRDFDWRLVRILEELRSAVQDQGVGLSLVGKGLTPDQEQRPLPTDPAITDHGRLDGLVPVIQNSFVQDYNDDHSQYALLFGRPDGQTLFGSRLTNARDFTASQSFTFAQNKVAGSSWSSIPVRTDAAVGTLVVLVLSSDDMAATGSTNTHTGMTDTAGGNTWTKHIEYTRQFSAGFGACVSIWTSVLSTALVAGTHTLTASFTTSVTAKSMEGYMFQVPPGTTISLAASTSDGANSGSNAPALSISGLTSSIQYLFVRGDANESDTIEAWTNDAGYTPFDQNDVQKQQSATSGGAARTNSATRAEFRILEGTASSTQPIFNISDFQIIASAMCAFKVSVEASGNLTLASIDNSNAATIELDDQFIHMRGAGNASNQLVVFEDEAGVDLSYIRASDGAFIGPIAPTPQFAFLNTTLFNDVVASAPVRGSLIVGNSTPAWERFPLGSAYALLQVNAAGTDPTWNNNIQINGDFEVFQPGNFTVGDIDYGVTGEGMTFSSAGNSGILYLQGTPPSGAAGISMQYLDGPMEAYFVIGSTPSNTVLLGTGTAHDLNIQTSATTRMTISSGGLISLMPTMGDDINMSTFSIYMGASDQARLRYDGTDVLLDASNGSGTGALNLTPTVRSSGSYSARQQILKISHSALQGGTTNTTAQTVALGTGTVTDAGLSASQFGMAQGLDLNVINTNATKAGNPKVAVAPYVLSLALTGDTAVMPSLDTAVLRLTGTYTTAATTLQTAILASVSGNSTSTAALTGVQGCQFLANNSTGGAGDARGFTGYGNLTNAAATGMGIGVFGYGSNSGNGANALSVGFLANTVGPGDSRQHYDIIGIKHAIHGALYVTTATTNLKTTNPATHLTPPTGSSVPTSDLFVGAHAEIDDTLWLDKVGDALVMAEGGNIVLGTSTGTKYGTATNQKQGWFNATPIVQPTTAIAAATFVTNTSLIADDSATFDGYTIGQVVKALRNLGFLA